MDANQITDKIAIEKFTYDYISISKKASNRYHRFLSCPILTTIQTQTLISSI